MMNWVKSLKWQRAVRIARIEDGRSLFWSRGSVFFDRYENQPESWANDIKLLLIRERNMRQRKFDSKWRPLFGLEI